MSVFSRPRFSSKLLRIALCQSALGYEEKVRNALHQELEGAICLTSFSEYDLIGLIPCSLDQIENETWQPYERWLRGYDEVLCFAWNNLTKPLKDILNLGSSITISFLKLDERLVRAFGIKLELAFIKKFNSMLKKARKESIFGTVYGTFGWSEIVIIWATPNFEAVAAKMVELRNLNAGSLRLLKPEADIYAEDYAKYPIFTTSHSLPCLNSDDNFENTPSVSQADSRLEATVSIVSKSNTDEQIINEIMSHQQFREDFRAYTTFGHYDIVVEPRSENLTIPTLLELIRFIRNLGPNVIHSVNTQIGSSLDNQTVEAHPAIDIQSQRSPSTQSAISGEIESWLTIVEGLEEFERKIGNPLMRFASPLYQMLARYHVGNSVKELEGLQDDLRVTLESIIFEANLMLSNSSILPVITPQLRKSYDSFEAAYQLIQFAFDQRISGTQIGIANTTSKVTHIRSAGIQRILTAARSIPNKLLWEFDKAGPMWHGFIVFGYENEILKKDFGIMNIPASVLFDPGEWWSLGHEAGHELADVLGLLSRPDVLTLIDRAALNYEDLPNSPGGDFLQSRTEIESLVEEIVAEVFGFQYACNRDWKLYRDLVWGYLQEFLEGRQSLERTIGYLLRSVFVYFYHLELEGAIGKLETVRSAIARGKELKDEIYSYSLDEAYYQVENESLPKNIKHRAFARYESVAHLIDSFLFPQIKAAAPKISSLISEIDPGLIAHWYESLEPLRTLLRDIFIQLGSDPENNPKTSLNKIKKELTNGHLCLKQEYRPIEIILALKLIKMESQPKYTNQGHWSQAVTAGLLSLWHLEKTSQNSYFGLEDLSKERGRDTHST